MSRFVELSVEIRDDETIAVFALIHPMASQAVMCAIDPKEDFWPALFLARMSGDRPVAIKYMTQKEAL
jgi:hypothetical protein